MMEIKRDLYLEKLIRHKHNIMYPIRWTQQEKGIA